VEVRDELGNSNGTLHVQIEVTDSDAQGLLNAGSVDLRAGKEIED